MRTLFLGPAFDTPNPIQNISNRDLKNLFGEIIGVLGWNAYEMPNRFKDENVWGFMRRNRERLRPFEQMSEDELRDIFRPIMRNYNNRYQPCLAESAAIIIQIALGKNILTDEDISDCIVEMVKLEYGENRQQIDRFIQVIKNALNDDICWKCVSQWPPPLLEGPLQYLKNIFVDSGYDVDGTTGPQSYSPEMFGMYSHDMYDNYPPDMFDPPARDV
jgi:hypothetical protein